MAEHEKPHITYHYAHGLWVCENDIACCVGSTLGIAYERWKALYDRWKALVDRQPTNEQREGE